MKNKSNNKLSKRKIELISLLVGGTVVGASAAIPAVLELSKDNSALTDAQLKLKQDEMIQNLIAKFNQMNEKQVQDYVRENVHSEKDIDKITREVMKLMSLSQQYASATLSPNSRNSRTSRAGNVAQSLSSTQVSSYIRSLLTLTQKVEIDNLLGYTPAEIGLVWTDADKLSNRQQDLVDKIRPLVITKLTADVKAKCAPLVAKGMATQPDVDAEIAKIVNIDNWTYLKSVSTDNNNSKRALINKIADQVSDVVSEAKIKYDIVTKFGMPNSTPQEVEASLQELYAKYPSLNLNADQALIDQLAAADRRLRGAESERERLRQEHERAVQEELDFLAQVGEAQRIHGMMGEIDTQIQSFKDAITALITALNAVSDAQGKAEAQAIAQANFNEALAEAQRAVNNLDIDKLNNALNEQAQASQAYNDANANYQTALAAYQEIQKMEASAQEALDAAKALQASWTGIASGTQTDLTALQGALDAAIKTLQTAIQAENDAHSVFEASKITEQQAKTAQTNAQQKAAATARELADAETALSDSETELTRLEGLLNTAKTEQATAQTEYDTATQERDDAQSAYDDALKAFEDAKAAIQQQIDDKSLEVSHYQQIIDTIQGELGRTYTAESITTKINQLTPQLPQLPQLEADLAHYKAIAAFTYNTQGDIDRSRSMLGLRMTIDGQTYTFPNVTWAQWSSYTWGDTASPASQALAAAGLPVLRSNDHPASFGYIMNNRVYTPAITESAKAEVTRLTALVNDLKNYQKYIDLRDALVAVAPINDELAELRLIIPYYSMTSTQIQAAIDAAPSPAQRDSTLADLAHYKAIAGFTYNAQGEIDRSRSMLGLRMTIDGQTYTFPNVTWAQWSSYTWGDTASPASQALAAAGLPVLRSNDHPASFGYIMNNRVYTQTITNNAKAEVTRLQGIVDSWPKISVDELEEIKDLVSEKESALSALNTAKQNATTAQTTLNTKNINLSNAQDAYEAQFTTRDNNIITRDTKQAADDIAQADRQAKEAAYQQALDAKTRNEEVFNAATEAREDAQAIKDDIQEAFDTKTVSDTVAQGMAGSLADLVAKAQDTYDRAHAAVAPALQRKNDALTAMQTAKTAFEEKQSIVDAFFRDATGGATGHVGLQAQSFNNLGTLLDTLKFLGDDTTRDITSLTGNQLVGQINIDEINAALNDLEKLDAMLTSITLRTNSVLAEVTLAQFNVDKANSAAALALQANEAANAALQAANDATNKFLAALVATTGQQALFDEAKAAAQDALNKAIEAATLAKQADDQAALALTSATTAHDNAVLEQTAKTNALATAEQEYQDAVDDLAEKQQAFDDAQAELEAKQQAAQDAQDEFDVAEQEFNDAKNAINDEKTAINEEISDLESEKNTLNQRIQVLQRELNGPISLSQLELRIASAQANTGNLASLQQELRHNQVLAAVDPNWTDQQKGDSLIAGLRIPNGDGTYRVIPDGVTGTYYAWHSIARGGNGSAAYLAARDALDAAGFPQLTRTDTYYWDWIKANWMTASAVATARTEVTRLSQLVNDINNLQKLIEYRDTLVRVDEINSELVTKNACLQLLTMSSAELSALIANEKSEEQIQDLQQELRHNQVIAAVDPNWSDQQKGDSLIAGLRIPNGDGTYRVIPDGVTGTYYAWHSIARGGNGSAAYLAARDALDAAGFPQLTRTDTYYWDWIKANWMTSSAVATARTEVTRITGILNDQAKIPAAKIMLPLLQELERTQPIFNQANIDKTNADSELQTAQTAFNTAQTNLDNAKDAFSAATTRRDAAQAAKDQADLTESSTKKTFDDATTNKENTAAQKEAADDAQAAAQALYNDANLAATQAGWAAANANTARTNAQNSQNAAQDANTKAQAAMSAIEQQVKAAQAILDSVNAKNAALLELKDTITQIRDASEDLVTAAQARYDADQAAIEAAQTALNLLLNTQGTAYTSLLGLTLNTLEYDEFISRINDALVKATEELRLLNAELTRITTNGSVYEAAYNSLVDQKADAEQELTDATAAAASANDALNAAKDGAEKAMADAYDPDATRRDAAADAAEAALASWVQAKAEAERINTLAQQAKNTAEQEFTAAQNKAGQTQTALDTATRNWEAAKTDLESKEQALVTAQQEKDQADQDLVTAQQEQDDAQAEYDEAVKVIRDIVSSIDDQISSKQTELDSLSQEISRLNTLLGKTYTTSQLEDLLSQPIPTESLGDLKRQLGDQRVIGGVVIGTRGIELSSTMVSGYTVDVNGTPITIPFNSNGTSVTLSQYNNYIGGSSNALLRSAGIPQNIPTTDHASASWLISNVFTQQNKDAAPAKITELELKILILEHHDDLEALHDAFELKSQVESAISTLTATKQYYSMTHAQLQEILDHNPTQPTESLDDLRRQLADQRVIGGVVIGTRGIELSSTMVSGYTVDVNGTPVTIPFNSNGTSVTLSQYNNYIGGSSNALLRSAGIPQNIPTTDHASASWLISNVFTQQNKDAAPAEIQRLTEIINLYPLIPIDEIRDIDNLIVQRDNALSALNTAKQGVTTAQTTANNKNQALQTATTNRDNAVITESNKHADYDTAKAADDIADNDLASKTAARDRAVAYAAQTAQALSETTTAHSKAQAAATAARANANDAQVNAAHADAVRQTAEEALSSAEQAGSGAMQLQTDAANKLAAIMQQYNQAERRWNRVQRDIDQATNARDSKQALVTMLTDIKTELTRLKALSHTPANSIDARIEEMQRFLMMYDGEYHSPEIDTAVAAHDAAVENVQVTLNALNRANNEVTNAQNAINQLERDLRTKQDAYEQALKQEEEAKARLAILQQRINDADTRLTAAEAAKVAADLELNGDATHDGINDEVVAALAELGLKEDAVDDAKNLFDTAYQAYTTIIDQEILRVRQLIASPECVMTQKEVDELANIELIRAKGTITNQTDMGGFVFYGTPPNGVETRYVIPNGLTWTQWYSWCDRSDVNHADVQPASRTIIQAAQAAGTLPPDSYGRAWLYPLFNASSNFKEGVLNHSLDGRYFELKEKQSGVIVTKLNEYILALEGWKTNYPTIDDLNAYKTSQKALDEIANIELIRSKGAITNQTDIGGFVFYGTPPNGVETRYVIPYGLTWTQWYSWCDRSDVSHADVLPASRTIIRAAQAAGTLPPDSYGRAWLYPLFNASSNFKDGVLNHSLDARYDELKAQYPPYMKYTSVDFLDDLISKLTPMLPLVEDLNDAENEYVIAKKSYDDLIVEKVQIQAKYDAAVAEVTRLTADKNALTTLSGDANNGLTALQTAVNTAHANTQTALHELEAARDALQAGIELVNTKIDNANSARGAYINAVGEARTTEIAFGQAIAEYLVANEATLKQELATEKADTETAFNNSATELATAESEYDEARANVYFVGAQDIIEAAIRHAKDIDLLEELTAGTYVETDVINNIFNNIVANALANEIQMTWLTKGVPVKDASGNLTGYGWFVDGPSTAVSLKDYFMGQLVGYTDEDGAAHAGLLSTHPYTNWAGVDAWIASLLGNLPDETAGTWTQSASAGLVWRQQPLEILGSDMASAFNKLFGDIKNDVEISGGTPLDASGNPVVDGDGNPVVLVGIRPSDADIWTFIDNLFDKNNFAEQLARDGSHDYTSQEARRLNSGVIATLIKDSADGTSVYYTAHRDEIIEYFATLEAYKAITDENLDVIDDKDTTDTSDDVITEHGFERLTNPSNTFITVENGAAVSTTGMTLTGTKATLAVLTPLVKAFEDAYNALGLEMAKLPDLETALSDAEAALAAVAAGQPTTTEEAAVNTARQELEAQQAVVQTAREAYEEAFANLYESRLHITNEEELIEFKELIAKVVIADSILVAFDKYTETAQVELNKLASTSSLDIDVPDTVTEFITMYFEALAYNVDANAADGLTDTDTDFREETPIDFTDAITEDEATEMANVVKAYVEDLVKDNVYGQLLEVFGQDHSTHTEIVASLEIIYNRFPAVDEEQPDGDDTTYERHESEGAEAIIGDLVDEILNAFKAYIAAPTDSDLADALDTAAITAKVENAIIMILLPEIEDHGVITQWTKELSSVAANAGKGWFLAGATDGNEVYEQLVGYTNAGGSRVAGLFQRHKALLANPDGSLVNTNVDTTSPEYQAAKDALDAANQALSASPSTARLIEEQKAAQLEFAIQAFIEILAGTGPLEAGINPDATTNTGLVWELQTIPVSSEEITAAFDHLVDLIKANADIVAMGISEDRIEEYVTELFQGTATTLDLTVDHADPITEGLNAGVIAQIVHDIKDGEQTYFDAHEDDIVTLFATEEANSYLTGKGVTFAEAIATATTYHRVAQAGTLDWHKAEWAEDMDSSLAAATASALGALTGQDTEVISFTGLSGVTNNKITSYVQLQEFKYIVDGIRVSKQLDAAFAAYQALHQVVPNVVFTIQEPGNVTEFINMYIEIAPNLTLTHPVTDWTTPLTQDQIDEMVEVVNQHIIDTLENEITDAVLDVWHLPHSTESERSTSVGKLAAKFPSNLGSDIHGARSELDALIDDIMYKDETDPISGDVNKVVDYTKLGTITQTSFDAKVREACIDMMVNYVESSAIVTSNHEILSTDQPGKVWYTLGTVKEQLMGHNFPVSPLGDYPQTNVPSLFDTLMDDLDPETAGDQPFDNFDQDIDAFLATVIGLGPDDVNNLTNGEYTAKTPAQTNHGLIWVEQQMKITQDQIESSLQYLVDLITAEDWVSDLTNFGLTSDEVTALIKDYANDFLDKNANEEHVIVLQDYEPNVAMTELEVAFITQILFDVKNNQHGFYDAHADEIRQDILSRVAKMYATEMLSSFVGMAGLTAQQVITDATRATYTYIIVKNNAALAQTGTALPAGQNGKFDSIAQLTTFKETVDNMAIASSIKAAFDEFELLHLHTLTGLSTTIPVDITEFITKYFEAVTYLGAQAPQIDFTSPLSGSDRTLMVTTVKEFIITQFEHEFQDAILGYFHLDHATDAQRSVSMTTLNTKFSTATEVITLVLDEVEGWVTRGFVEPTGENAYLVAAYVRSATSTPTSVNLTQLARLVAINIVSAYISEDVNNGIGTGANAPRPGNPVTTTDGNAWIWSLSDSVFNQLNTGSTHLDYVNLLTTAQAAQLGQLFTAYKELAVAIAAQNAAGITAARNKIAALAPTITETSVWDEHYATFTSWSQIDTFLTALTGTGYSTTDANYHGIAWTIEPVGFTRADIDGVFNALVAAINANADVAALKQAGIAAGVWTVQTADAFINTYVDNLIDKNANAPLARRDYGIDEAQTMLNAALVARVKVDVDLTNAKAGTGTMTLPVAQSNANAINPDGTPNTGSTYVSTGDDHIAFYIPEAITYVADELAELYVEHFGLDFIDVTTPTNKFVGIDSGNTGASEISGFDMGADNVITDKAEFDRFITFANKVIMFESIKDSLTKFNQLNIKIPAGFTTTLPTTPLAYMQLYFAGITRTSGTSIDFAAVAARPTHKLTTAEQETIRDVVRAEIVALVDIEFNNKVLDAFHLPHATPTQYSDSMMKLEVALANAKASIPPTWNDASFRAPAPVTTTTSHDADNIISAWSAKWNAQAQVTTGFNLQAMVDGATIEILSYLIVANADYQRWEGMQVPARAQRTYAPNGTQSNQDTEGNRQAVILQLTSTNSQQGLYDQFKSTFTSFGSLNAFVAKLVGTGPIAIPGTTAEGIRWREYENATDTATIEAAIKYLADDIFGDVGRPGGLPAGTSRDAVDSFVRNLFGNPPVGKSYSAMEARTAGIDVNAINLVFADKQAGTHTYYNANKQDFAGFFYTQLAMNYALSKITTSTTPSNAQKGQATNLFNQAINPTLGLAGYNPVTHAPITINGVTPIVITKVITQAEFDDLGNEISPEVTEDINNIADQAMLDAFKAIVDNIIISQQMEKALTAFNTRHVVLPANPAFDGIIPSTLSQFIALFAEGVKTSPVTVTNWQSLTPQEISAIGDVVLAQVKANTIKAVYKTMFGYVGLPSTTDTQYNDSLAKFNAKFPRASSIVTTEVNKLFETNTQATLQSWTAAQDESYVRNIFAKIVTTVVETHPNVAGNIGKPIATGASDGYFVRDTVGKQIEVLFATSVPNIFGNWATIDTAINTIAGPGPFVNKNGNPGIVWVAKPLSVTEAELKAAFNLLVTNIKSDTRIQEIFRIMGVNTPAAQDLLVRTFVDDLFDATDGLDLVNPNSRDFRFYGAGEAGTMLNMGAVYQLKEDAANHTTYYWDAMAENIVTMFATAQAKEYAAQSGIDFNFAANPASVAAAIDFDAWSTITIHGVGVEQNGEFVITSPDMLRDFRETVDQMNAAEAFTKAYDKYLELSVIIPEAASAASQTFKVDGPDDVSEFINMYLSHTEQSTSWLNNWYNNPAHTPLTDAQISALADNVKDIVIDLMKYNIKANIMTIFKFNRPLTTESEIGSAWTAFLTLTKVGANGDLVVEQAINMLLDDIMLYQGLMGEMTTHWHSTLADGQHDEQDAADFYKDVAMHFLEQAVIAKPTLDGMDADFKPGLAYFAVMGIYHQIHGLDGALNVIYPGQEINSLWDKYYPAFAARGSFTEQSFNQLVNDIAGPGPIRGRTAPDVQPYTGNGLQWAILPRSIESDQVRAAYEKMVDDIMAIPDIRAMGITEASVREYVLSIFTRVEDPDGAGPIAGVHYKIWETGTYQTADVFRELQPGNIFPAMKALGFMNSGANNRNGSDVTWFWDTTRNPLVNGQPTDPEIPVNEHGELYEKTIAYFATQLARRESFTNVISQAEQVKAIMDPNSEFVVIGTVTWNNGVPTITYNRDANIMHGLTPGNSATYGSDYLVGSAAELSGYRAVGAAMAMHYSLDYAFTVFKNYVSGTAWDANKDGRIDPTDPIESPAPHPIYGNANDHQHAMPTTLLEFADLYFSEIYAQIDNIKLNGDGNKANIFEPLSRVEGNEMAMRVWELANMPNYDALAQTYITNLGFDIKGVFGPDGKFGTIDDPKDAPYAGRGKLTATRAQVIDYMIDNLVKQMNVNGGLIDTVVKAAADVATSLNIISSEVLTLAQDENSDVRKQLVAAITNTLKTTNSFPRNAAEIQGLVEDAVLDLMLGESYFTDIVSRYDRHAANDVSPIHGIVWNVEVTVADAQRVAGSEIAKIRNAFQYLTFEERVHMILESQEAFAISLMWDNYDEMLTSAFNQLPERSTSGGRSRLLWSDVELYFEQHQNENGFKDITTRISEWVDAENGDADDTHPIPAMPSITVMYNHIAEIMQEVTKAANDEYIQFLNYLDSVGGTARERLANDEDNFGGIINPSAAQGVSSPVTYNELESIRNNLGNYVVESVMSADHGVITDDSWRNAFAALVSSDENFNNIKTFVETRPDDTSRHVDNWDEDEMLAIPPVAEENQFLEQVGTSTYVSHSTPEVANAHSATTGEAVESSTTLYIGLNLLRFDFVTVNGVKTVSGISIVAQDSDVPEVVSSVKLNEDYNLREMSIELQIENPTQDVINISTRTVGRDVEVTFTRISHRTTSGMPDYRWVSSERMTIIGGKFMDDAGTPNDPTDDIPGEAFVEREGEKELQAHTDAHDASYGLFQGRSRTPMNFGVVYEVSYRLPSYGSHSDSSSDSLYALKSGATVAQSGIQPPASPVYGDKVDLTITVDNNAQALRVQEGNVIKVINNGTTNFDVQHDTGTSHSNKSELTWLWITLLSLSVAGLFGIIWIMFRRNKLRKQAALEGENEFDDQDYSASQLTPAEELKRAIAELQHTQNVRLSDTFDTTALRLEPEAPKYTQKQPPKPVGETKTVLNTGLVKTSRVTEVRNKNIRVGIINVPEYKDEVITPVNATSFKEVKVSPKKTTTKKK